MCSSISIPYVTKDLPKYMDSLRFDISALPEHLEKYYNETFTKIYMPATPTLRDIYEVFKDGNTYEFLEFIKVNKGEFAAATYQYVENAGRLRMGPIDTLDTLDDDLLFNNLSKIIIEALKVFYD